MKDKVLEALQNGKIIEALSAIERELPHAQFQWKGTFEVCMDIRCSCGEITHYDGDSPYCVKCPVCGKVYFCNPIIELIEIPKKADGTYTENDDFYIRNATDE